MPIFTPHTWTCIAGPLTGSSIQRAVAGVHGLLYEAIEQGRCRMIPHTCGFLHVCWTSRSGNCQDLLLIAFYFVASVKAGRLVRVSGSSTLQDRRSASSTGRTNIPKSSGWNLRRGHAPSIEGCLGAFCMTASRAPKFPSRRMVRRVGLQQIFLMLPRRTLCPS